MTLPDIDSLASYGGALANYSPVVDPETDEDAAHRNRYACNVAMMTQTAPRAICSFVGVTGTTPTDPGGFVHAALWGGGGGVKPTVSWSSTGIWLVTWPTDVDTDLTNEPAAKGGGDSHSVNLRRAIAQVEIAGTTYVAATARVTAANVVEVRGWLASALDDLNGYVVTVVAW